QTGREPPDASQRAWGGLEQQEGPAADRGEDPPPFAVLQGTRGPARGLGLLVESFGTPSEVGGRWRSASRTWPRPGSSNELDLLESLPYPVIVLDHHNPIRDSDKLAHVNPHFEGVDGAREMCGATTTWLFTLVLDEANWDLAGPAMAGATGDKQAVGGFLGVN